MTTRMNTLPMAVPLIVVILILLLVLAEARCTVSHFNVQRDEKYGHYTAEQCIPDKACVWNAFSRIAFGTEYSDPNDMRYQRIVKWNAAASPVTFDILGDPHNRFRGYVEKHLMHMGRYIPAPALKMYEKGDPSVDAVIVFTDDIRRAIAYDHQDLFSVAYKRIVGDEDYLTKSYDKVSQHGKPMCFGNVITQTDYSLGLFTVFINTNLPTQYIAGCPAPNLCASFRETRHTFLGVIFAA